MNNTRVIVLPGPQRRRAQSWWLEEAKHEVQVDDRAEAGRHPQCNETVNNMYLVCWAIIQQLLILSPWWPPDSESKEAWDNVSAKSGRSGKVYVFQAMGLSLMGCSLGDQAICYLCIGYH